MLVVDEAVLVSSGGRLRRAKALTINIMGHYERDLSEPGCEICVAESALGPARLEEYD